VVVKSFFVHLKTQNMFDFGESGAGHLLMQPDHTPLGHFDVQYSRIRERNGLHGPYEVGHTPVLLASTPEFSHIFRPCLLLIS
jgi:hypothetical protein